MRTVGTRVLCHNKEMEGTRVLFCTTRAPGVHVVFAKSPGFFFF